MKNVLSSHQKALAINLDPKYYGTFAEIGAGQEVARNFFRVGGAAGTVAKSMSAYDMIFSDAIYGREPSGRYVCQTRLQHMLDHEYDLLVKRLWEHRAQTTCFFAFADTVAAKSFKNQHNCHGWLGLKFQLEPEGEPNFLHLHVRLLDSDILMQQQVLGTIGVNMIYAAFYHGDDPDQLLKSLMDNIAPNRIAIDLAELTGPKFASVDNHIIGLKLVEFGFTEALVFDESGKIVSAAEALYKRNVLIQRGSFRPVTYVNMNMRECAYRQFINEPNYQDAKPCLLMEITLANLHSAGYDYQDFLDRIELLNTLGCQVLISNFQEYTKLATYIRQYSKQMLVLVMGLVELQQLLNEANETNGACQLTTFADILGYRGKLYVYPSLDQNTQQLITSQTIPVDPKLKGLLDYFRNNGYLHDMIDCDITKLTIFSKEVLRMIQAKEPQWEQMVPPEVRRVIKEKKLWHHD